MKILTIFLNLVYISSGIYFLINKNILNFALCIFCLVSSIILNYLRKISFIKTNSLYSVCNLFLFFATILGSCFDFYGLINHYDDFLHMWSGFITVAIGYNLLISINDRIYVRKIFVILYLFTFSMGVASVWEITEFLFDTFLGTQMQRGLNDTMFDMIDALIGTIIMILLYSKRLSNFKEPFKI